MYNYFVTCKFTDNIIDFHRLSQTLVFSFSSYRIYFPIFTWKSLWKTKKDLKYTNFDRKMYNYFVTCKFTDNFIDSHRFSQTLVFSFSSYRIYFPIFTWKSLPSANKNLKWTFVAEKRQTNVEIWRLSVNSSDLYRVWYMIYTISAVFSNIFYTRVHKRTI
jgi:hypothetical protein